MTTIERTDRDLQIWRIRDVMSRVGPEDMTDAELAAAIAVLTLAALRLSPKPIFRIQLDTTGFDLPRMNGTGSG